MTDTNVPNPVLQPDSFEPSRARPPRRARIISWVQVISAVLTLFVVFGLWFIFTAKSVKLEPNVVGAEVEIIDALPIKTGSRYLLRPGFYNIRGRVAGYHDLEQVIEVGRESQQTIPINFERLPGLVTLTSTPVGATISLNGQQIGQTPFSGDIAAGQATFALTAPRYQDGTIPMDIEGMAREQSAHLDLAPNWGTITIPTQPDGATILIDDQDSGFSTPGPAEILAGEHEIVVKKQGYSPWKDLIWVEAGETRILDSVELNPIQGAITIVSTPASASVTINGKFKGITPLPNVEVKPNEDIQIEVLLAGYHIDKRQISLNPGQERTINVDLEEEIGELEVITVPEDIELYVDGVKVSVPADRKLKLHAINHHVEIKKEGYAGWARELDVRPGQKQQVKVQLLTNEEAELAYLKQNSTTVDGQQLQLLQPTPILMGATRSQPGRRANEPFRTTQLERMFYIGVKEVTNADFRKFQPHDSGDFQGHNLNDDDQPVVNVSWNLAALYCNYLSEKQGIEPFYITRDDIVIDADRNSIGYRLPSEAEWSWAARHVWDQQDLLLFPWGSKFTPPDDRLGNFADEAATHVVPQIIIGYNDNHTVSAPVGTFPANTKGIYDLAGNVAEWVHDYYAIPAVDSVIENLGPRQGKYRVMRGSSYLQGTVTDLRLSFRDYGTEGRQDVGFRIARYAKKE